MIESLQGQDKELDYIGISRQDILNSITLLDVKFFLESLGVNEIEVYEDKGYLICPTICHNSLQEEASMKLYWYQNNKIFRCYTECNEAMSIFTLYQKFMALNYHPVSLEEAENYVKYCLKHIIVNQHKKSKWDLNLDLYKFSSKVPVLQEYPETSLSCFIKYYHPLWLKDGITKAAMDKFNIRFSINQNKIIIPHYDINHRLIGIRGRTLNEDEMSLGKYRPIQIGDILYTHPLQFNLYGIYEHSFGIKKRKSAIIAEAEKSVLLDDGYYNELSNTVACCGSTFNKYHISLLTDYLGVNEIVVALDKEYKNWDDNKAKKYREKIEKMCKVYINQVNFSYIWDFNNLLEEKDSPFDKGKNIFEYLYKTRVKVK